jgi:hypothetical protein
MKPKKIAAKGPIPTNTAKRLEEQIRRRAYELYLARKGEPGSDVQDWLQAEAEIMWNLNH